MKRYLVDIEKSKQEFAKLRFRDAFCRLILVLLMLCADYLFLSPRRPVRMRVVKSSFSAVYDREIIFVMGLGFSKMNSVKRSLFSSP